MFEDFMERLAYTIILILYASTMACKGISSPRDTPPNVTSSNTLKGPLKVLSDNPRHFADSRGMAVYLTGSHTHLNMLDREGEDPDFNFDTYLAFLEKHHHNFIRLWAWEDSGHIPLPYQRVGPERALDGKPKFNLLRFNEEFFEQLRARVRAAQNHNIYVAIMLFNGWSVESKMPNRNIWIRHPFHRDNNVNGIDSDVNGDGEGAEVHTLMNPSVTAIQEAYVKKVIDSVNDLDNVLFEISNESAATLENTGWQYHMIELIHEYERSKLKQHPVGMTVQWPNGSNQVLYQSPADWISPNTDEGYDVNPRATKHGKVILNDSDHVSGVSVNWVWMNFARGLNPIFMDLFPPLSSRYTLEEADEIRRAMGDTLKFAQRMNLGQAEPRPDTCSTTFCLVNSGQEYMVYFPQTGQCSTPLADRFHKCQLTVDLSRAETETMFDVEWFSINTRRSSHGVTHGGAVRTFIPPFSGASVLYLKAQ